MATIYDLPLETIGRIINIAYPVAPLGTGRDGPRTQFLLAVALVCRAWTPFAQQELWLGVYLDGSSIPQFIAAGPGRHAVQKLELLLVGSTPQQTEGILRTVRGVRDLLLSSGQINGDWLCGENLRELKSLALFFLTELPSGIVPTFAFDLVALRIAVYNEPALKPCFATSELLATLSCQSSISTLQFIARGVSTTEALKRLSRLAPQLVTLEIDSTRGDPGKFLECCTRLKHLSIHRTWLRTMSKVVVPLESWTPVRMGPEDFATTLEVLKSDCVAVAKLERLSLGAYLPGCDVQSIPEWTELEERCREKKMVLMFDDMRNAREPLR